MVATAALVLSAILLVVAWSAVPTPAPISPLEARSDATPIGALGKVKLGQVTVEGIAEPEPYVAVIRSAKHLLRACYEGHLVEAPGTHGTYAITLLVAGDGTVVGTEGTASQLGSPSLEGCMRAELEKQAFPPPTTPARIRIEMSLRKR
jgi:hypothetical protein